MGDYNLTALSTREFEHLIQALARKYISTGVTPFGDGPDGGREATCRGATGYRGVRGQEWNGYLVVQAKFRQQPAGDPKKDGDWALEQLRGEVDKFLGEKRNLPRPDYYLFATNVKLSAVQDSGSKDKALNLGEELAGKLPVKDYDIWDYDKIRCLLDDAADIRRRYAHFIVAGDVLSDVIQRLEGVRPDFETVMAKYLQRGLFADRYARLAQAGSLRQEQTALERVFIDLPAFKNLTNDPPHEKTGSSGRLPAGFLAKMLEAGDQRLDQHSHRHAPVRQDIGEEPPDSAVPGRFVLVGGPGHGKSTLGQFLCQLYRATILKDRDPEKLEAETLDGLRHLQAQCEADGLAFPGARRFPVRIVLSQFADDLAGGGVDSLLGYIAARIEKLTSETVQVSDVRRWLGAYPWVVVLDGLDEVPATANRSELLDEVRQFWIECAESHADVLVLATTRPQGYSEEFSPAYYQHRYLAPMSVPRAMHYARRLADVQFAHDLEGKEGALKLLSKASEDEGTARLMRSPLQVTIMHTLVEQGGEPPRERWKLFSRYYSVVYDREKQKGTELSQILRDFSEHVDFIHRQVALRLQIDSERTGSTQAHLATDQLRKMIDTRLRAAEFDDSEVTSVGEQIQQATTDRLVFLVPPQRGRVGFEIRSIQEFMAAEALMSDYAEEKELVARLEEIAPIAHWRNVFLFAAGRCFAERDHLGQMIVGICETLNHRDDDRIWSATLAGSRLALDLLADGAARQQPKYLKALSEIALRLLELPPENAHDRLAAVFQPRVETVYRDALVTRLGTPSWQRGFGAWRVLLNLIAEDHAWAISLANKQWPKDSRRGHQIMLSLGHRAPSKWYSPKVTAAAARTPDLWELYQLLIGFRSRRQSYLPDWMHAASQLIFRHAPRGDQKAILKLADGLDPALQLRYTPINGAFSTWTLALLKAPDPMGVWATWVAGAKSAAKPTGESLTGILRWLVGRWDPRQHDSFGGLSPWPLDACLAACRATDDLAEIAARAEKGQFGETGDWVAAQMRWAEQGITREDILGLTDMRWPYDRQVRESGFPCSLPVETVNLDSDRAQRIIDCLEGLHAEVSRGRTRSMLAKWILEVYGDVASYGVLREKGETLARLPDPGLLRGLIEEASDRFFDMSALHHLPWPEELSDEWLDFLDWLGRPEQRLWAIPGREPAALGKALQESFIRQPRRVGLLRLLYELTGTRAELTVPRDLLSVDRYEEPRDGVFASTIRLVQPDLSESEAEIIASTIAQADDFPKAARHALGSLENREGQGAPAERFVLSLLSHIPEHDAETHWLAHQLLRGWLDHRRTGLSQSKRKREVGLGFLAELAEG